MLAGDFNLIYWAEDKNNDNVDRAMMGRFPWVLNDLHLKEVDLLGRRFTWSNERAVPTLVRLDRVFCTVEWEDSFPNHLLCLCPLVLSPKGSEWGRRRFHFEMFCPKLQGFGDTVAQAWNDPRNVTSACPGDRLALKLLATSRALQSWNQKKVGNIATQLQQARKLLLRFDVAQES